jgi:hypothetical protein
MVGYVFVAVVAFAVLVGDDYDVIVVVVAFVVSVVDDYEVAVVIIAFAILVFDDYDVVVFVVVFAVLVVDDYVAVVVVDDSLVIVVLVHRCCYIKILVSGILLYFRDFEQFLLFLSHLALPPFLLLPSSFP